MSHSHEQFYQTLDGFFRRSDIIGAEQYLKSIIEGLNPESLVIAALNELASIYRIDGRLSQAEDLFRLAGKKIEALLGKQSFQYATVMSNLAGVYRVMGKNQQAYDCFIEAKGIYEQTLGEENPYYAGLLANIAILHHEMGEVDQSIRNLQKSVVILRLLPNSSEELATTLSNLSAFYQQAGDLQKAYQLINESLQLFSTMENSVHYPGALTNKATLLVRDGRDEEAEKLYKQSNQLTEGFFGKNVDYATGCSNLATLYEQRGDYSLALQYAQEAYDLYLTMLGENHVRTKRVAEKINQLKVGMG